MASDATRVPARLAVLVSGTGTNLQALLQAAAAPGFGASVVAVGADRHGTGGVARAESARIPTFVTRVQDYPDRASWDLALTARVREHRPDLVVTAGFLKLLGPAFLDAFPGRVVNTHPALLPAFPGGSAVREALAAAVKVTGCTVHLVDEGIDTGPVIGQGAVPVLDDDDEATLHERIKTVERRLLVDLVGRMAREGWSVNGRKVTIP